jgi:hypothetical protein
LMLVAVLAGLIYTAFLITLITERKSLHGHSTSIHGTQNEPIRGHPR